MKKVLFFSIFILLNSFWNPKLAAQIHDFDSLINNNESFEQIAEIVGDTLDIFNKEEVLQVVIESDFKNLIKRKYKDEYQDAIFTTMFNDSVRVVRTIKIKPRGVMRKGECFIPPLKLNFAKKDAYIKQLKYFDKLKMVLDCKRGDSYEQYLLSEYYAYKIYNLINDYSLRVRLLHVTYIDTSGKFKEITRYAFLIESIDQLAERHNSIEIEPKNIRDVRTNLDILADVYMFQYLIGNTDWSIPGDHNMYCIKSKDPQVFSPVVIPYDFDYAGIVEASYAIPDENLGTESVRERVYRGFCSVNKHAEHSVKKFLIRKQEVYDLYTKDQFLSKGNKRSTIKYLDEFYNILENEKSYKRNILGNCR